MDGIDSTVSTGFRPVTTVGPQAQATPVTAATDTAPAKTGAQTEAANLISLLAGAAPPIDAKKVEAIRSLIAQGRYPIDERAIASKMIALDVTAH
jgi:negative regulator of flagellin synthesis FlgM